MEHVPQGINGVSLADRTVRQLGVEVANSQISLATQNARLEELVEVSAHINFDLWEEIPARPVGNETVDADQVLPPAPPSSAQSYLVPVYQADAVARLLSLLQRQ